MTTNFLILDSGFWIADLKNFFVKRHLRTGTCYLKWVKALAALKNLKSKIRNRKF